MVEKEVRVKEEERVKVEVKVGVYLGRVEYNKGRNVRVE